MMHNYVSCRAAPGPSMVKSLSLHSHTSTVPYELFIFHTSEA